MQELTGWRRPAVALAAITALAMTLQACVLVPRSTAVYDAECRGLVRHMVLEEVQIGAIQHCANEGCAALVVTAGVVAAASLVISGSIVVAGNAATWLERRSGCPGGAPVPAGS